ncbi:hypothetical protein JCM8097_002426 [Rhodosporidiobolus ruineniae]
MSTVAPLAATSSATSSSLKPMAAFRRFFSTSRSDFSPLDEGDLKAVKENARKPAQDPEAILKEILALNARHGALEVQAYSIPSLPKSPRKKSPKVDKPPKYSARPPASAQDTFDEIMRLNQRHGAPDVQALFVKR